MTGPDRVLLKRTAMLRDVLPTGASVAGRDPNQDCPEPHAEELAGLSDRAIAKRRREFYAGRAAVRDAMFQAGMRAAPVPVGTDRAPIWPAGVTGSITHTATFAAAAVAKADRFRVLGLDAEEAVPLDEKLIPQILLAPEREWILTQPDPLLMAKVIFSAKEAAYKAQYTISHTYFGFSGMETTWDVSNGRYTATFTRDAGPFRAGHALHGRFVIGEGLILTVMAVEGING